MFGEKVIEIEGEFEFVLFGVHQVDQPLSESIANPPFEISGVVGIGTGGAGINQTLDQFVGKLLGSVRVGWIEAEFLFADDECGGVPGIAVVSRPGLRFVLLEAVALLLFCGRRVG